MTGRAGWLVHDALLEQAERQPDRPAVVTDDRELTYGALAAAATGVARGLKRHGLERGDRVAIQMENTWECCAAIFGALIAGGVFVVLHPQTKGDKLDYILADSEASFLVTEENLIRAHGGIPRAPASLRAVISTAAPDAPWDVPVLAWDDFVDESAPLPGGAATIPLDLASLIYTSGSTGDPKGVMMAHRNMVFTTESLVRYLRLDARDRILNVLPLSFDYGLYQLLMAVALGATLVLERSFAFPARTAERVSDLDVTVFPGVPTIFARLLSLAKGQALTFPSVRRVTNTAAAMPPDFVPELRSVFPNALVYLMYGLTECKRVSYLEPELVERKPRSVGKAIPGTEAFVLLPDGRQAGPGEVGTLHVRGPHVMAGYWRRPDLSAEMLREGPVPGEQMLCTHDFFTVDDEGDLYFVGRSDEIINTAGQKVSPVEVEEALYSIAGVREAAVVGVPDAVLGEAIHAYVAVDNGTLTEAGVKRACRERLEGFMVPARVVFRESLPKTGSGKIRKEALRADGARA